MRLSYNALIKQTFLLFKALLQKGRRKAWRRMRRWLSHQVTVLHRHNWSTRSKPLPKYTSPASEPASWILNDYRLYNIPSAWKVLSVGYRAAIQIITLPFEFRLIYSFRNSCSGSSSTKWNKNSSMTWVQANMEWAFSCGGCWSTMPGLFQRYFQYAPVIRSALTQLRNE